MATALGEVALGTMEFETYQLIGGYRGDSTNTIVGGGESTAVQQRSYEGCLAAMAAAQAHLRPGMPYSDPFAIPADQISDLFRLRTVLIRPAIVANSSTRSCPSRRFNDRASN